MCIHTQYVLMIIVFTHVSSNRFNTNNMIPNQIKLNSIDFRQFQLYHMLRMHGDGLLIP